MPKSTSSKPSSTRTARRRSGVEPTRRPTPAELRAARGKRVADVIAPKLNILFIGINPGLYSGAVGHHFARPGNRFWPALYRAGLTPRQLAPQDERELLKHGIGISNLVSRTTAAASELRPAEITRGGKRLITKLRRYRPRFVVLLGIGAYRTAFGARPTAVGPQPDRIGNTPVWLLPNPSGLNANYQLDDFVRLFRRLRNALPRA